MDIMKIQKLLSQFFHIFIIKGIKNLTGFHLKYLFSQCYKYLRSVTDGLKYYLENDKKIKKNQFGTHRWFSN